MIIVAKNKAILSPSPISNLANNPQKYKTNKNAVLRNAIVFANDFLKILAKLIPEKIVSNKVIKYDICFLLIKNSINAKKREGYII